MPRPLPTAAFQDRNAVKFGWIAHQLGNYQNRQLERYDLTHQQAKILAYLYLDEAPDVSQRDIEEFFAVKASTITSVVGNLERKGFLQRRPDERDGRRKRLLLTEKGKSVQRELAREMEEMDRQLVRGLSEQEQDSLRRLLDRVGCNLRDGLSAMPEKERGRAL